MKIFFIFIWACFILSFAQAEVIKPRFKRISNYRFAPSTDVPVLTVIDGSTAAENTNDDASNLVVENIQTETTSNPADTTNIEPSQKSTVGIIETTTTTLNPVLKKVEKQRSKNFTKKLGRKHSGIVGNDQDSTLHDGEVSVAGNSSVVNASEANNANNIHGQDVAETAAVTNTQNSMISDANTTPTHTTTVKSVDAHTH